MNPPTKNTCKNTWREGETTQSRQARNLKALLAVCLEEAVAKASEACLARLGVGLEACLDHVCGRHKICRGCPSDGPRKKKIRFAQRLIELNRGLGGK